VRLHPAGRLALGAGGLGAAALAHDLSVMIAGSLACAVAVWRLSGSMQPVRRALRWLLWLAIPILLLHMFLTPGALIRPGLPVTREGLDIGVHLAVRLVFLFLAAMVCSRLLRMEEWRAMLCRMPVLGGGMDAWLRLLAPVQGRTMAAIRRHAPMWRRNAPHRWPALLVSLLAEALEGGRTEAHKVWRDWEHAAPAESFPALDARAWLAMTTGLLLPWVAWLA